MIFQLAIRVIYNDCPRLIFLSLTSVCFFDEVGCALVRAKATGGIGGVHGWRDIQRETCIIHFIERAPATPRHSRTTTPESPPYPVILLTSSFATRDTTVVRRFLGKLCRARPSGPYAMPATGFVSQDPVAEKTEHGDVFTSE